MFSERPKMSVEQSHFSDEFDDDDPTESIDLNSLLVPDFKVSGSFELPEVNYDSVGRLLQALPVATLLVNKSHRIQFANDAFVGLGEVKHNPAGESVCALLRDPKGASETERALARVFAARKPEVREGYAELCGSRPWVRTHFRSLRVGPEQFVLIQIENLTAEKQLQQIQKYKDLINTLPVAVVEFAMPDPMPLSLPDDRLLKAILEAGIVDANQESLEIFRGESPTDLFGNRLETLLPSANRDTGTLVDWARSGFSPCVFEACTGPGEEGRWLEYTLTASIANGAIFGFWCLARDVTSRKRREKEMVKTEKLESLGLLAGGIAHDFNNLLTGIMGNISFARELLPPNHQAHEKLDTATKASVRAQGLTLQLLTFSQGGAPIKRTVAIAHLLRETVNFSTVGANVRCELCLSDDLWDVDVDEGQISLVIGNLLINSIQAMHNGGRIKVNAGNVVSEGNGRLPLKQGRYVKVTVVDNGTGIAPEHLPKIFDPYFTTKTKGTGLGLSTSYSVLKKHEGLITVRSEPGVGSAFSIYLPASARAARVTHPAPEFRRPASGKILLVEDEDVIRELAAELLTHHGYEVSTVREGAQAVALYRSALASNKPFDLVVMDLTVPGGMGGRETIAELTKLDPKVRAVVSSGYSNDPVMADYEAYGFIGVLPKPYDAETMTSLLAGLFRH